MTLVVLIGGARAGKSAFALELAARWNGPVAYVATGEARDDEMAARIELHRAERPSEWTTIEEPLALHDALGGLREQELAIVDCLTLWVANLLERGDSDDAVVGAARSVADAAAARVAPVVAVTNEVGLGVVPATPLGRAFRDVLGAVNRVFVERSETSALVVAGRPLRLEGAQTFGSWG